MDRETQLIDSLPGMLLRQWMNIWIGLIFHFPFSEAKGSVGSENTSSSSQLTLHWCCHGHTVPKASSRGRVQSRTEKSQVQSSFESLQILQTIPKSRLPSVWKKMSYLIRFPILHLVTAASCPSLCLSEDSLALPALRSGWEILPASSCTSCGSAFTFALTALTAAWHGPCSTGEPRIEHRVQIILQKEGRDYSCVLAALLPLQPSVLLAGGWLSTALTFNLWVTIEYSIFYVYTICSKFIILWYLIMWRKKK